MLQLPEKRSALKLTKSGPMKGVPAACQATCRVFALGIQYEKLVLQFYIADDEDRLADADRLRDKMDRIAERVSRMSPKSYEGAAFQIMLASAAMYFIGNALTDELKEETRERAQRLLVRAMEKIGYKNDDGWEVLRGWLLPKHLNRTPRNRKGSR